MQQWIEVRGAARWRIRVIEIAGGIVEEAPLRATAERRSRDAVLKTRRRCATRAACGDVRREEVAAYRRAVAEAPHAAAFGASAVSADADIRGAAGAALGEVFTERV